MNTASDSNPKISAADNGYVVITPARNEEAYIAHTIDSMMSQSELPLRWVIVDDGSTDATPDIVAEAERRHPWICLLRRKDRGFRHAGQGVIEAFYAGFETIRDLPWDFVVKFDGDLSFGRDYFRDCFARFAENPKLGIGGGYCCIDLNGRIEPEFDGDPPFHVRGPTKLYRRKCWEDIDGLYSVPGWDGIDEIKANMMGWKTATFRDIRLIHHRPTGGAYGTWRNQTKYGVANYVMGYHPVFMACKCLKRSVIPPYLIGSIALAWGYTSAWLGKCKRVPDPELLSYARSQQWRALTGRDSLWRPVVTEEDGSVS